MSLNSFHFNGIFLACNFLGNFLIFFLGIFCEFFLDSFRFFKGVYLGTNWVILVILVVLIQVPNYLEKGQDFDDFLRTRGTPGKTPKWKLGDLMGLDRKLVEIPAPSSKWERPGEPNFLGFLLEYFSHSPTIIQRRVKFLGRFRAAWSSRIDPVPSSDPSVDSWENS